MTLPTPDKDPQVQEAESRKYDAPIVIPLSSGGFAICLPDRQLWCITDSAGLPFHVAAAQAGWNAGKAERAARQRRVRSTPDLDSIIEGLVL